MRFCVLLVAVVSFCPLSSSVATAQHFGRNKVEYVDFDFQVLHTEHFAVYYYPSEEAGARIVARLAERWYARLARVLGHQLASRQPLILYGSQPEFAQTNVVDGFLGEGIGGVTESARRRIVMPFAPTLAETDRILGHELTHAFQFDMARHYGGVLGWPLWAVEGLAQYLSLGSTDNETAMWLRDAAMFDLIPARQQDAARKFSPYRYGHALWMYIAARFGDRAIPDILKAKSAGSLHKRIKSATGVEMDQLFADWRQAALERHGSQQAPTRIAGTSPLFPPGRAGRLYLGPSLSPDGRHVIFFSERDRLSLDLYLADTSTGAIIRKLATTTGSARFESLQAIRSAGAWGPEGDRFVYAAIERGQPALVVLDMDRPGRQQEISLPQFGQVLTPTWSPDGRALAFSGLKGGITDLYVYDLASGSLQQLTDDVYADLQPEWSPDGGQIAFATDRLSTDLSTLRFGRFQLALVDVSSGAVRPLTAIDHVHRTTPRWSADGGSLYFVSNPDGVSNVYRLHLESRAIERITNVQSGVTGLTPTSPALSAARSAPVLAFTVYRRGEYDIELRRGEPVLSTAAIVNPPIDGDAPDSDEPGSDLVEQVLHDSTTGLPGTESQEPHAYDPDLFLEAIGPPYISSGGGPFGTFVRGGGSLLFSDLLGERKVALAAQAGNRLRDLAVSVRFINRERRWNWGAIVEAQPSLRRLPLTRVGDVDGEPAVVRDSTYYERTQFRLAGVLAYPLDRAQRLEFQTGARHTVFRRTVSSVSRSGLDGRVLHRSTTSGSGGAPATVGEASAAYVRDTAVFGPTSPILGGRSRFEVAASFGDLAVTRVLLDHRRYMMPIKPYTIAMRLVHLGQYGPDAHDQRLLPTFLGSREFVRGYGWNSSLCRPHAQDACGAFEELLGSRLLVANVEVRAPLLGFRSRDLRYGPVPAEGFVFFDSGLVWARSPAFVAASRGRRMVSSLGLGVRLNAFGLPFELAAVRATDPPSHGWSVDFSFRSGF